MSILRFVLVSGCAGAATCPVAAIAQTQSEQDASRAMVAEMLHDAERRSSLLQGGGTSGHDGGFFLASGDGDFTLRVSGQVQFRWVLNTVNDDVNAAYMPNPTVGGFANDDVQHGFENSRTKLRFEGTVGSGWFYGVESDLSGSTFGPVGLARLEDAYVGFEMTNGARLQFGQFKAPMYRHESIDSRHLQAVDRPLSNEWFAAHFYGFRRSKGVSYTESRGDRFRHTLSLTDGIVQANTTALDTRNEGGSGLGDADLALTWRGEVLVEGDRSVFKDMTSAPGQSAAMMIGLGAHYQIGANEPSGRDDSNYGAVSIDFSWEGDGWNVFVAGSYSNTQHRNIQALTTRGEDFGFVIQGGYYVSDTREVFARYDMLVLDEDAFRSAGPFTGNDAISTITIGINEYVHGHAAKLTIDANLALDPAASFGSTPSGASPYRPRGIGYIGDDNEGEFYLRAQLQLLF